MMRFAVAALAWVLAAPAVAGDFQTLREIPIPGPLGDAGPRLVDDRILVEVADGIAASGWDDGSEALLLPGAFTPPPPLSERWAISGDNRWRARIDDRGRLEMQKKCKRCKRGWRRRWRARLPANSLSPPVVGEKHVFVGLMDNRVYALKCSNGHRVWEADVGARVTRPLLLVDGEAFRNVLVVIPGTGKRLLAMNGADGSRLGEMVLAEGAALIGGAVTTPDGSIVVAQQRYRREDAALLVLRLGAGDPEDEDSAPMPYNVDSKEGQAPLDDPAAAPERPPDRETPRRTGGAR